MKKDWCKNCLWLFCQTGYIECSHDKEQEIKGEKNNCLTQPHNKEGSKTMTIEEAIKILSDARDMLIKANEIYGMHDFEKAKEAYDMAIRALGELKPLDEAFCVPIEK